MSKFNAKKKPVTPTVVNKMGERSYTLEAKEELVSTILTTFLSGSYYEKEQGIVSRILAAADKCDPVFVAKAALYARRDANMRSVTHLLAGYLATKLSGSEVGKEFFNKIVQRPDDMSEILAYIKSKSKGKLKVPNNIKKGFRVYLENMDAYQMDKYKMKTKELSLVDLVNLLHPKPHQGNEKAFEALMSGKPLDGLYTSKILQKTMTKAGQVAKKDKVTEEQADELKGDAIAEVVNSSKGIPIFNLIRNLRNIINYSDEDTFVKAISQLAVPSKIANSKLLPFRFLSAYNEIAKLKPAAIVNKSSVKFEKEGSSQGTINDRINVTLMALEEALSLSIANIPKLSGNTAILVDHSGSMRGDGGGSSLVSALSKTTTADIGNVFAAMMAHSQDNVYMGLFGDRLFNYKIDRSKGPLEMCKEIHLEGSKCGGGTENGLYMFLYDCIKNKVKVDNLIIFSDMVIGSGGEGGWDVSSHAGLGNFQSLFKQFKAVNPTCNTVCVNLRQTDGKDVFHKSLNVTQVAGWSERIFDVVANAGKGYSEIIKEIEAIVI